MRGAMRRSGRAAALLLVLALPIAGCTYENREPGLFERTPVSTPAETEGAPGPADRPAVLPVLGEATWTTVDPPGTVVRIAVHSLRRVPGGTVLDWSVTAVSTPGGGPGQPVPGGLRLGLDELRDVVLVDASADRVYRALVSRDGRRGCLCTPVGLAESDLTLGEPRLLQVAYPELPADTRVIDVSVALAPVFSRVPVSPLGEVPLAIAATDLARPVEAEEPRGRTTDFALPSGQRFAIEVDAVVASGTLTSVVWSLEVLSPGPGPGSGLRPELTRNDVWRAAPLRLGSSGAGGAVCLCLSPGAWREQLQEPGRRITVVTNIGEIPRGTTTVDVRFPGVPPVRGVRVTPASDAAYRSAGTEAGPRRTWTFRPDRSQPGWRLDDWPTPAPRIVEGDFTDTVDPILR